MMRFLKLTLLLIAVTITPASAQQNDANILAYFMVGQDYAPEVSIQFHDFRDQMALISKEAYPISTMNMLSLWKRNETLPDKSIAVSFDGGQRSILTHALPILKKHSIPFTVFIAPKRADIGHPRYLDWKDIKTLKKTGLATIGFHPFSYASFTKPDDLQKEINSARARFREELGSVPRLFSFPYGSYSPESLKLVLDTGFIPFGHKQIPAQNTMHQKYYEPLPRHIMTDTRTHTLKLEMILKDSE